MFGGVQQIGRGRAVAPPVGANPALEKSQRPDVVIGEQNMPRDRRNSHAAQRHRHRETRGASSDAAGAIGVGVVRAGQCSARCERVSSGVELAGEIRRMRIRRSREIEITPIDAKIIPIFFEHGLLLRTDSQRRHTGQVKSPPFDALIGSIDGQRGRRVEIDFRGVRLRAGGIRGPNQVSHRARKHLEIPRQRGREKRKRQVNPCAFEFIDRAGREDLDALLRQGGQVPRVAAHNAE